MKYILFTAVFLLSAISLYSQEEILPRADSVQVRNSYEIDLTKIELPPVSAFLEAAQDYADVKMMDSKVKEGNMALKEIKRDWLAYLRVQGNYQYGTTNTYLTQAGDIIAPGYVSSATNKQDFYNIGVILSIPLNDLASRKQKTGMAKERIEQARYEAERALEERKLIILEAYNEVVKHLSILKVKAEAVALYDAQMQISEDDFVNGRINIIELSLERGRRSEAMVKYEESRAALHNAVTLLEMLTKIKIIKQ